MKYEWRKQDKTLYLPKSQPCIINVPPLSYIAITGQGNPNSPEFSKQVSALYTFAYGIRMSPKKQIDIPGYYEYTVFPLEGVWDLSLKGQRQYEQDESVSNMKDQLVYTIMIRQPEFVTKDVFHNMQTLLFQSKKDKTLLDIQYLTVEEGLCCQMMHIGPYDTEDASFAKMEDFIINQGYERLHHSHKEIYLSDPTKVSPDKLKTTLRFQIKQK